MPIRAFAFRKQVGHFELVLIEKFSCIANREFPCLLCEGDLLQR